MLKDVRRFGAEAPKVLDDDETYRNMTLGDYLLKHKYSRSFTYNYVLPMCAAIWSVSNKCCLEFSIQVLLLLLLLLLLTSEATAGARG